MIAILTIVTQLHLVQPTGVQLKPAYTITEPNDIQPAIGVNYYQHTVDVSRLQPASLTNRFQPTVRGEQLQHTVSPQWQL